MRLTPTVYRIWRNLVEAFKEVDLSLVCLPPGSEIQIREFLPESDEGGDAAVKQNVDDDTFTFIVFELYPVPLPTPLSVSSCSTSPSN